MKLIEEIKNIEMSQKKLREFGLFVGGIFLAIGGLLFWKGRPAYPYFCGGGAFLVFFGALWPGFLKPLYKVWMGFALVMGFVMSHILLGILFYLVVTPISILAKMMKNNLLDTRFPDKKESYWTACKQPENPADYEKQY